MTWTAPTIKVLGHRAYRLDGEATAWPPDAASILVERIAVVHM